MSRIAILIFCLGLAACESARPLSAEQGKRLIRSTGCTNCHDKDRPLVGPSFAALATQYTARPDAAALLEKSLEQKNIGPHQAKLAPNEKRAMIQWILSLSSSPTL